jgi:tellurite resistance protein TerC
MSVSMHGQELLSGLSTIAGLVVLEGLLSVDNVLGIAALASELPPSQQRPAIRIGLALAYGFRVLALTAASWLASNTWVRWLGASYLLWLMSAHLSKGHAHDVAAAVEHDAEVVDDTGLGGADGRAESPRWTTPVAPTRSRYSGVLVQIGLMDLSLSIDNVIAAVGLAPTTDQGDPVMWPIYAGVLIAILALQVITPHAVNLLRRFPVLEPTAFVLIGYVGVLLIVEEGARAAGAPIHLPPSAKFVGILVIMWLALFYAADGAVRRAVRPIVRVAVPVMRGFARAVMWLLRPLARIVDRVSGVAAES